MCRFSPPRRSRRRSAIRQDTPLGAVRAHWGGGVTILAALLCHGDLAWAGFGDLNLTPGVTGTSRMVFDLHMLIFWICLVIALLVFGAMAYAIARHRKSRGAMAAGFHGNVALEISWTLVPLMILGAMAAAATRVLVYMDDTGNSDLTVKVTGYQWRWQYDYLDQGVTFFSSLATDRKAISGDAPKGENYLREVDNPLVLPVGRKIRFIMTSNDVIHAWWVPALGWKKDAIPGFINEAWAMIDEPGIHRGQCAELCGRDHAFMPIVVEAKTEAEFAKWLDAKKAEQARGEQAAARTWSGEQLLEKGAKLYLSTCAACHQPDGKGVPDVFPDLTASAIVKGPLKMHLDVVLNGRPNTAMQAFGPQMSDLELAAVVTYERTTFGESPSPVQPAQVKAARMQRPSNQQAGGNMP